MLSGIGVAVGAEVARMVTLTVGGVEEGAVADAVSVERFAWAGWQAAMMVTVRMVSSRRTLGARDERFERFCMSNYSSLRYTWSNIDIAYRVEFNGKSDEKKRGETTSRRPTSITRDWC